MSSPDLLPDSEDELFNLSYRPAHETVETVPVRRPYGDKQNDSEYETIATLPLHAGISTTQNAIASLSTQPTQIRNRSSPDLISSPSKPIVQVGASSPLPAFNPPKKTSILSSIMAPAGTTFRSPFAPTYRPREAITIDSDDEGPTYQGGSSDDDHTDLRKNDIKTSMFKRQNDEGTEKVPDSPYANGNERFRAITQGSFYNGSSFAAPAKRSADVMANAYGNVYKKPRQDAPSRAFPVPQKLKSEMELNDIMDPNLRQKVKRMLACLSPTESVRTCYEALRVKKGNYDDAVEYCFKMRDDQDSRPKANPIDLTGSEDELMPTPLVPKRPAMNQVKQNARVPERSIAEKWSSTNNGKKIAPKPIAVFEEPPKARRLIRGRRDRSSPIAEPEPDRSKSRIRSQVVSDDEDEGDSRLVSDSEDVSLQPRLLNFFNNCSVADLADTASISLESAEHIVSKRPFKNMSAVGAVEDPNVKPQKGNRGSRVVALGAKVADKVEEMLTSYEAVDYLVRKCENLAQPLASEMKSWGINIYGSQDGELDIVSLQNSPSHDSGIGTPVSDDDHDLVKRNGSKRYIAQPAIMAEDIQMKDYQVVGINWLNMLFQRNLSGILADDMGLGKTCQVIGFLAHLLEIGEKGPHLIVVPAATLENWLKEFNRFCPELHVEPYYSTNPRERFEIREDIDAARNDINVVITTYTLAKGKDDFPWLKHFGFCCTIFDEGHVLKNAESQLSRKLIKIESKFRLLLTGTPLQNNLKELISLLAFLMPPMFNEKRDDLQAIFSHHVKALDDNHDALLSAQRIARARTMLIPFILRRKKYQVLKDLPKKTRRVEYCNMTNEQVELYQMFLAKAYSIRERRAKGENIFNESTHILMRLRQAAIHPFLFRRIYKDKQLPVIAKQCLKDEMWKESNPDLIVIELREYSDMEIHTLCDDHQVLRQFACNNNEWLASGKIQKMLELLRTFMAEGHRTLIFSQFTMVLDILELVLEREAIAYFRLDGNTKVSTRQDLIDEFCHEDNHTPVFMLSTKAGGAGINLAKANKVIVFDSGFNPQDDIQAENRAHRIGQVKDVEVVRLISKGTIEEQVYAMGLTKLKLDEQVAGESGEEQNRKDDEETEKEREGREMVEQLFFKKLEAEPEDLVKAEVGGENVTNPTTLNDDDDDDDEKKDKLATNDIEPKSSEASAATVTGQEDSLETTDQVITDLPSQPNGSQKRARKLKKSKN